MNSKRFIELLKASALEIGLDQIRSSNNRLSIWLSGLTGLVTHVEVNKSRKPKFYFYLKTSSWNYSGERTDLHDVISTAFACFLKEIEITSSALLDIGNPALPELDDAEIYGRYILPVQIPSRFNSLEDDGVQAYKDLLLNVKFFEVSFWSFFKGCPCDECRKRLGIDYEYKIELPNDFNTKVTKALGNSKNINPKDRALPSWKYYRDFDKKTTIIESKSLSDFLIKCIMSNSELIEGIEVQLLVGKEFQNILSQKMSRQISSNFQFFDVCQNSEFLFILLENKVIAISSHIVQFIDASSGLNEFKIQKEKLRDRHIKEFRTLFAESSINWRPKIKGSDFESMILELLSKEIEINWVRKSSHTNESDQGVDLIAEIKVYKNQDELTENDSPFTLKRVIIQCKAYANGVGKADIQDIRDTIDHFDCDGFFLVVSSYLKRSLTEHLDRMRNRGTYWIDWWTKDEINQRLIQNPEIVKKFPEIFVP